MGQALDDPLMDDLMDEVTPLMDETTWWIARSG